jgi:SAM-dependent methyltransferase
MHSVRQHYESVLAKHYTWMSGTSFESKVAEQRTFLNDTLSESSSCLGLAVDLGSGPGYQSIALAEMGFNPVIAIDTSAALLSELRTRQGTLPIQTVEDEIAHLDKYVSPQAARVIVCMGDTITHLESKSAVLASVRSVAKTILPGGAFILTYRDLSTELCGLDRFIPVHSDSERVMTCFLEFDHPESVLVHDLVYTRKGARWNLEKSCYRKLRLPVEWLEQAMTSVGFAVSRCPAGRLIGLVGRKA